MARPLGRIEISVTINGSAWRGTVPVNEFLVDFLRRRVGLYGTKKSCGLQVCGSCTVLVEGSPISSCSTLAYSIDKKSVLTIEGLQKNEALHPLQEAFVRERAAQCGFCTSGQLMAAAALLSEHPSPTYEMVAEWMSGNICRCGCYPAIARAILGVAADNNDIGESETK